MWTARLLALWHSEKGPWILLGLAYVVLLGAVAGVI